MDLPQSEISAVIDYIGWWLINDRNEKQLLYTAPEEELAEAKL